MRIIRALMVAGAMFAFPMMAVAEDQSVTLKVTGMTCSSCPYQVQSALKRVQGVKAATATLATHEAVVQFDDAVTNVAALTKATTEAGFPSVLKPNEVTKPQ